MIQTAPIFILSPAKRSGTNFVKNLLCRHRDCASPGPIWEDDVLRHAHLLRQYARATYAQWNPDWSVPHRLAPPHRFERYLGDAVLQLLLDQMDAVGPGRPGVPLRFVTKSPRIENLALFPDLFPDAFLLIVVRDGCRTADSAKVSFGKPYDMAFREWARAMRRIEDFCSSPGFDPARHRVVRYEDLQRADRAAICDLLHFLHLDPEAMDWDAVKALPVTGSSDLRRQGRAMDWTPRAKDAAFDGRDPLRDWSPFLRSHFAFVSGRAGAFCGYDAGTVARRWLPLHILRAALWWPVFRAWRVTLNLRQDLRGLLSRAWVT